MRQRADAVDGTRRRITEAAVALHGSVGPARTTISAVAERAGVQRLTVYRHFPDETALFVACSTHWIAANPPPATGSWASIADPMERSTRALGELYAYFARTSEMWDRIYRDAPAVTALQAPFGEWLRYLDEARDVLLAGWRVRGAARRRLRVAIGHALSFTTWSSLTRQGASTSAAVVLMKGMLIAVANSAGTD
jgi:AcrR family transcriptional regulator